MSLPSQHEGGAVTVTHNNLTRRLESAPLSGTEYQYLAWYTDVSHEVEPITDGTRIVMTYHLCLKDEEGLHARYLEPGDPEVIALCAALRS